MFWRKKPVSRKVLLAKVVSRVFDPVVVLPLIFLGIYLRAVLEGFRLPFWWLFAFFYLVVPGLYIGIRFYRLKGTDWDIHERRERLPLFITTLFSHGVAVVLGLVLLEQNMAFLLLGLWLLAVIFGAVTYFWKISIHAGVNATLAALVVGYFGWDYWWVWLIPLIVSWARVVDKDHSVGQVIAGTFLPPIFFYFYFGVVGV